MSIEMITIGELLRDPQYRQFFKTVPQLPPHYTPANLPWKLIVHKPGESVWRSKRFGTYKEAFLAFKTMLPKIDNAAINCPALSFNPPSKLVLLKGQYDRKGKQVRAIKVWKPQITADMETHNWCPHCRRPTVFHIATTPPRKRADYFVPAGAPALRCTICGASERVIDLRNPANHQQWDDNRLRVS